MAPEVLAKGVAYDSSADWFSFGCMLYKLLKGHSPFRQHKSKVSMVSMNILLLCVTLYKILSELVRSVTKKRFLTVRFSVRLFLHANFRNLHYCMKFEQK